MENNQTDNRDHRAKADENKKVQIEIVRHRDLLSILRDPRMTWKAILSLFIVLVILFFGLTFVTLAIKSIYPYNSITTTKYGATIIKSEDKEVIYWLFNTADLWANSGIEVHKNDVISIRASGKSNNAIHHLVRDFKNNTNLTYKWTGPEGLASDEGKNASRDKERRKYRIAPNENEGVLLMQVIPEKYQNRGSEQKENVFFKDTLHPYLIDGRPYTAVKKENKTDIYPDIYVIGEGKDEQVIRTDGILHFAVNDVALTGRMIDSMRADSSKDLEIGKVYDDTSILVKAENKNSLVLCQCEPDTRYIDELDLYKQEDFVDAWFVDNLGSFLIVIERKN